MIFWVTRACNFSCAHCFNHLWNGNSQDDLSVAEIEKISNNMGHVKYLTLAGGEPLLRDDLDLIAEIFYTHNDLQMLNLVTNGWLTDRAETVVTGVLDRCPGLHLSVGVSVDGPEEIHDHFRSKPGSYRRAIQTLERLKKNRHYGRRLTVAACGTYHAGNAVYLLDLARFFQNEMGLPYYAGLIRGQQVPDMKLKAVDPDHYKKLCDDIGFSVNTELAPQYPFRHLRIAVDRIVTEIIYKSLKHNRKTVTCQAGKKGFVLTAGGDILLCEVLNTVLGNVREFGYSPYAVLDRSESVKAIEKIRENGCHCTWECFQRLNVVFSPGMLPRVLMRMLR